MIRCLDQLLRSHAFSCLLTTPFFFASESLFLLDHSLSHRKREGEGEKEGNTCLCIKERERKRENVLCLNYREINLGKHVFVLMKTERERGKHVFVYER